MRLLEQQRQWEKERVQWQIERDKEDREWRERQSARERQWRTEDRKDAEKAFQRERYKGWAIALWTLIASMSTWFIAFATLI